MPESQQRLIRGLEIPSPDSLRTNLDSGLDVDHRLRIAAKLIYEFWGFCINAPSSLTTPDAIPFHDLPSGFDDAVEVTGTDGATSFSTPGLFVASAGWDTSHVGKYLVTWKPGEESPDDSIYRILEVRDSTRIIVDNFGGGGVIAFGNRPTFSDRTGIWFRVVDIDPIGELAGYANGQSMVLTLSGSADVNVDQENSQVRLYFDSTTTRRIRLQVSPSGSWNGSTFLDGSSIISPLSVYQLGGSNDTCFYYLAGSKDHILLHMHAYGETDSEACGIYVEIPRRLYPSNIDPNPIAFMTYNASHDWIASGIGDQTFGESLYMVSHDGTTERYLPAHRLYLSENSTLLQTSQPVWNSTNSSFLEGRQYFDFERDKKLNFSLSTDVTLYQQIAGRFSMSRVRLRKVRATHGHSPRGTRHGRNWIHVRDGVMYPWDNASIPLGSFWRRS